MNFRSDSARRREIFEKVKKYYRRFHAGKPFEPGKSFVAYGGRVYDEKEMINLVDSALDFWLTSGRHVDAFEKKLGKLLGVRHVSLVNSGSSANLLAFMALTHLVRAINLFNLPPNPTMVYWMVLMIQTVIMTLVLVWDRRRHHQSLLVENTLLISWRK